MQHIVIDEQRSPGPKSARRFAVACASALEGVACLRVASVTRPRCAPTQRACAGDPGTFTRPGQALA